MSLLLIRSCDLVHYSCASPYASLLHIEIWIAGEDLQRRLLQERARAASLDVQVKALCIELARAREAAGEHGLQQLWQCAPHVNLRRITILSATFPCWHLLIWHNTILILLLGKSSQAQYTWRRIAHGVVGQAGNTFSPHTKCS